MPWMISLRSLSSVLLDLLRTIAMIAAAGRVGAAVRTGAAPSESDLALAGLSDAEILRRPLRV